MSPFSRATWDEQNKPTSLSLIIRRCYSVAVTESKWKQRPRGWSTLHQILKFRSALISMEDGKTTSETELWVKTRAMGSLDELLKQGLAETGMNIRAEDWQWASARWMCLLFNASQLFRKCVCNPKSLSVDLHIGKVTSLLHTCPVETEQGNAAPFWLSYHKHVSFLRSIWCHADVGGLCCLLFECVWLHCWYYCLKNQDKTITTTP